MSRHEGHIWADSHDQGAFFLLCCRIGERSLREISRVPILRRVKSLKRRLSVNSGVIRRTILVGEDDAEVRDYLEVTLRCRGYDVQLAADGEEAVNYLRAGGLPPQFFSTS